jgi:deoxyribose-phosphate aldolase
MDVPPRIEHTVLGPTTTRDDAVAAAETAADLGARVCVPPVHVPAAVDAGPDVVTVVGFPHGHHATEVKCAEAARAWEDGAAEIDAVADLGSARAGDWAAVEADIAEVVSAVPVPVKAIVEAPLLSEAELRRACEAARDAGADFVKTATGFADGGATVADVSVMAEYLPVKASGGIGSWERAKAMFEAGAERIGASAGDTILREYRERDDASGGD